MAEQIHNHHFADFRAEGTISLKSVSRIVSGRSESEVGSGTLGTVNVAIESSRFNNGNKWFLSTGPENGLFVIHSIEHVLRKIIMPGRNHPTIQSFDILEASGSFTHINPTGYTADDLANGMHFDHEENSVGFAQAKLVVPDFSHHEPTLRVTIEKIISPLK